MSENHYYDEDGDIFLVVNNEEFLVHKLVLSLCSEFFKNKFVSTKSKMIKLEGETSESIERMLAFIYPNTVVSITWDNVRDFLRISNKFKINAIRRHCNIFLLQNFQYNPLLTIKLAEEYSFSDAFKESSKLILDDFQKYSSDPDFKLLSLETQLKLHSCWFDYFNKLQEFIYKYREELVYHDNVEVNLNKYISEKFVTKFLKPSSLINAFKSISFKNYYNQFICNSPKRIVIN